LVYSSPVNPVPRERKRITKDVRLWPANTHKLDFPLNLPEMAIRVPKPTYGVLCVCVCKTYE
jgi:hypothetical protein